MFRQVLYTQWKWARMELLLYVLLAFIIPVIGVGFRPSATTDFSVRAWMNASKALGAMFASLAFVAGVTLAARPWTKDDAGRHIYAMSLPVAWSHFVRLRFLAGTVLLTVPTAALWLGGLASTASANLPSTLRAYAGGVTVRFYLSALLFYAATFLLQYVAGRNAGRVAAGAFIGLTVIELAGQIFGYGSTLGGAWDLLTTWPGPFDTLTARWMLIDV